MLNGISGVGEMNWYFVLSNYLNIRMCVKTFPVLWCGTLRMLNVQHLFCTLSSTISMSEKDEGVGASHSIYF